MNGVKVGDRAVIIKYPCCGEHLFDVMLVTDIQKVFGGNRYIIRCNACGGDSEFSGVLAIDNTVPSGLTYVVNCPIEWLKPRNIKIEDEEVIREKEIDHANN